MSPKPRMPLEIANAYLAAYAAGDNEALASFYTDDAVWEDPTSPEIGGAGDPVQGRQAILDHLTAAAQVIQGLEFTFTKQFHSAGRVVSSGSFSYDIPHFDPAKAGQILHFELDTVIVLELEGERIARHTDYADFEAWKVQLQEQNER